MSKFTGVLLMGMGNPLLDISVDVEQDLLDKYDVKLDSAILAEEKHMSLYSELTSSSSTYQPQYIAGGATQNSIRVAQWMLTNDEKKHETAYLGCVGDDEYANILERCATKDGVLVHYMKDPSTATGTCAVLVKGGERSLIANLAAAQNFRPSHLQTPLAKQIIESAKCFYCAGFFLTVSVESLVQVAEHALQHGKTFCLNLSAPFIIEFYKDAVQTALPYADFVFCNESEAETYAKIHKLEEGISLKDVALQLAASPKKNEQRPRTVIFTQGSQPTIVAYDGVVNEYSVEPLDKELLVDTNGAGDAMVGGFLSQLVQDKNLEECVKAGHYAARYIIQQSGTTISKPCDYKH